MIIRDSFVCFGAKRVPYEFQYHGGSSVSQLILVTSFKGGVGKTTLSANLAASLAARSKNVLVCDCDLESRCLDCCLCFSEIPLFRFRFPVKPHFPTTSSISFILCMIAVLYE